MCHLTLGIKREHSLNSNVDSCKLVGLKHNLQERHQTVSVSGQSQRINILL